MADYNNLYFAQISPANRQAHEVFEAAVAEALAQADENDLRMYRASGANINLNTQQPSLPPPGSGGPSESGSELPNTERESLDPRNTLAALSLSGELLPKFPLLGWRVGKRCSQVDIAIAASEYEESLKFRLSLHPQSGVLMLHAGVNTTKPLQYISTAQRYVTLSPQQSLVLLSPSTRVAVAGCEFDIVYNLSEEQGEVFYPKLVIFLREKYGSQISGKGLALPSHADFHMMGDYALGNVLGCGTFGDVRYALDRRTGDPVAIKDVRTKPGPERAELKEEVTVMKIVKGDDSFMQLRDCWCAVHKLSPVDCPGEKPEHTYLVTDIALGSFTDSVFKALPFATTLVMFRQILVGISKLHYHNVMHRDITAPNLFVMSTSPPRAVVGDFGKAVRTLRNSGACIGPVPYSPPEVWEGEYDEAVDVWQWAFVALNYLGFRCTPREKVAQISRLKLGLMTAFLRAKAQAEEKREPKMSDLCGLLLLIFVWDRQERLTVDEALEHYVWRDLATPTTPSPEENGESEPPAKRIDRGTASPKGSTGSGQLPSTLPLSEAS